MTREICKICGKESAVGFSVPDKTWRQVTEGRWNVLCLGCFTRLGDDLGIEWDLAIEFFPVSRITLNQHLTA